MTAKRTPCISPTTGRPLRDWPDARTAEAGARRAKLQYNREYVPYQCPVCDQFHLAPRDRSSRVARSATCTGRNGQPKCEYHSEEDARRAAAAREATSDSVLDVYRCDTCGLWHLTRARTAA